MIRVLLSIMFVIIVFSGCGKCEPVFIEKIVKVNIPIKCVTPDVNCTFSGNDTEVVAQMIGCIYEHKQAAKVCK